MSIKFHNHLPPSKPIFNIEWKALIILVSGCMITSIATYQTYQQVERLAALEFENFCYNIKAEITSQLDSNSLYSLNFSSSTLLIDSIDKQRDSVINWKNSPDRIDDLVTNILGDWDKITKKRIRLQIVENEHSISSPIYDSQKGDFIDNNDYTTRALELPLKFNNTNWILRFFQYEHHLPTNQSMTIVVFTSGILITISIFVLYLSLFKSSLKAQQIAKNLTFELEKSKMQVRQDTHGKPEAILVNMSDINELKQKEERLEKQQYLMQTLMDYLPDHIYFKDLDSKFIKINKSHARLFGLDDPDLAIGKSDSDFFSGEHSKQAFEDEQEIIRTGKPMINEEKETYTNRPDTWVSTVKMPMFNNKGEIIGTFGISRDITRQHLERQEIKLKNEELQKLNAEKDKFFSIIAHDLKSPFNTIVGFSDLLVEMVKEKDNDGIVEYSGIIQQSSQRAMELLMNLMEWSRSQTGRMEFNPILLDMVELINESVFLLSGAYMEKSIAINETLPPKIFVYADEDMICTVLRNLITNAIKFSYPGGKINISTDEKQGLLTVSISDNGVGIPKENIDKLFRIDENYSTPGTMGESGTGLGLILCKEFIEKHGGKIWAESNCDGSDKQQEKIINGSTFYFTIPNATEKQEENILDGLLPGDKTENHG